MDRARFEQILSRENALAEQAFGADWLITRGLRGDDDIALYKAVVLSPLRLELGDDAEWNAYRREVFSRDRIASTRGANGGKRFSEVEPGLVRYSTGKRASRREAKMRKAQEAAPPDVLRPYQRAARAAYAYADAVWEAQIDERRSE